MTAVATAAGIDHSFASALKATRKGGTPENAISKAQATKTLKAQATADLKAANESALETLKLAWAHTDGTLATADLAFKKAKEDLDIQRVYKCRIAIQVAILKASARSKGEPNLSGAATFLGVDKATLRPYVEGGKAGVAAGFGEATGTPTKEEIKATMDGYRAATKEGKALAKQGQEGGEGEGDTKGKGKEESQDPVTQDDVVAAVENLQSILARFTREQGFSAVVADNLQTVLAELGATIEQFKVDGGN